MKISSDDRKILESWGCTEQDIKQIARAMSKTEFVYRGKRISADEASALLGRRCFLSGMARSAFHFSAGRETDDGEMVYFDSSRFFK